MPAAPAQSNNALQLHQRRGRTRRVVAASGYTTGKEKVTRRGGRRQRECAHAESGCIGVKAGCRARGSGRQKPGCKSGAHLPCTTEPNTTTSAKAESMPRATGMVPRAGSARISEHARRGQALRRSRLVGCCTLHRPRKGQRTHAAVGGAPRACTALMPTRPGRPRQATCATGWNAQVSCGRAGQGKHTCRRQSHDAAARDTSCRKVARCAQRPDGAHGAARRG